MVLSCLDAPQHYRFMPDEDIIQYARRGDGPAVEYLMTKYRSLVEHKARTFYVSGAEHEDVVQEGMIGLYKAIRDYRSDRLAHFRSFAEICVTRQIITALKTARRQKHIPLNGSLSLTSCEEYETPLQDIIRDEHSCDPAISFLEGIRFREFNEGLESSLSPMEMQVLHCYLNGMTYQEISDFLCKRPKSIDNALQRIKRKVEYIRKKSPATPLPASVAQLVEQRFCKAKVNGSSPL